MNEIGEAQDKRCQVIRFVLLFILFISSLIVDFIVFVYLKFFFFLNSASFFFCVVSLYHFILSKFAVSLHFRLYISRYLYK